jgi:hypothetical protein
LAEAPVTDRSARFNAELDAYFNDEFADDSIGEFADEPALGIDIGFSASR